MIGVTVSTILNRAHNSASPATGACGHILVLFFPRCDSEVHETDGRVKWDGTGGEWDGSGGRVGREEEWGESGGGVG